MQKFLAPDFLSGETTPTVLQQIVSAILPSAVWQSVVDFCLLISVCEAWQ